MKPAVTFTGTMQFVVGCEECTEKVIVFVTQAITNGNVSSVTLRAGQTHNHEVRAAAPPTPQPNHELFPSDTNGSDPKAVERWMNRETGG